MRNWLLQKLTRKKLSTFLADKGSDDVTLEVGSAFRPQRHLFPAVISGDILFYPQMDVQFDAHNLPFADKAFSMIVCIEVLEHCHTPQQVINEFYRLLKDEGQLLLSTRFIFPIHDAPHDYYRYTKYGLQHLMKDFSSVAIQEEAHSVVTVGVLLQRLAYQIDWYIPLTKIFLLFIAKILPLFQKTIKKEYGDIRKSTEEQTILSSGYYIKAIK